MEFVGLEFDFVADPGQPGRQVQGIDVEEFIHFPADLLAEFAFILDAEDEIRRLHLESPLKFAAQAEARLDRQDFA